MIEMNEYTQYEGKRELWFDGRLLHRGQSKLPVYHCLMYLSYICDQRCVNKSNAPYWHICSSYHQTFFTYSFSQVKSLPFGV